MSECHQIFISYSHDTAQHKQAVLDFVNQLRAEGVDAWVDQYETAPAEGWPRWMEQQIEGATFVLMVCTEMYHNRVKMRAAEGKGLGALWEGNLIYQTVYEAGTINKKFIPLLPEGGRETHIPSPLRGSQHYSPFTEPGYTELYRRLTGQPAIVAPKLGPQKRLLPHATPARSPEQQSAKTIACSTSPRAVIILPDEKVLTFPPVVLCKWHKNEAGFLFEPDADDAVSVGLLAMLRDHRHNVHLAYKNNAGIGYPGEVEQITSDGQDRWQVSFHLNKTDFSQVMEFNGPELTADEAAILRAKRLLLNEQPSKPSGRRFDNTLTELQVAGQGEGISIKDSPFPNFLKTVDMRTQDNLEAAWVYAVLHLKLSGTVEHISRLDLTMSGDKLDVVFSGRRPKKYSNQPAFQIDVTGTCSLAG